MAQSIRLQNMIDKQNVLIEMTDDAELVITTKPAYQSHNARNMHSVNFSADGRLKEMLSRADLWFIDDNFTLLDPEFRIEVHRCQDTIRYHISSEGQSLQLPFVKPYLARYMGYIIGSQYSNAQIISFELSRANLPAADRSKLDLANSFFEKINGYNLQQFKDFEVVNY